MFPEGSEKAGMGSIRGESMEVVIDVDELSVGDLYAESGGIGDVCALPFLSRRFMKSNSSSRSLILSCNR